MAKSAKEHLNSHKEFKKAVLDKDFPGIKKGQQLFIVTPKIIDDYINKIPVGEVRTIERMRRELARRWKTDAICPVSSAIFIRISAPAAIDEMEKRKAVSEVTPFWRLLTSKDKITKRLSVDPDWLDLQRAAEQARGHM